MINIFCEQIEGGSPVGKIVVNYTLLLIKEIEYNKWINHTLLACLQEQPWPQLILPSKVRRARKNKTLLCKITTALTTSILKMSNWLGLSNISGK